MASLLMALSLLVVAESTFVRERLLEATQLQAPAVSILIQSELTGTLRWVYTNSDDLSVELKISGESELQVNCTHVNFTATNDSVLLNIKEQCPGVKPAAVAGTASFIPVPEYLVWLPTLLIGWKRLKVMMLMVLANSFYGRADVNTNVQVYIEVRAPRRFVYRNITLFIQNGEINMSGESPVGSKNVTCQTQRFYEGCPDCCYGRGSCVLGNCLAISTQTTAKVDESNKQTHIFFSHPVDPRFEQLVSSDGDTITLSRAFQLIQRRQFLRNPDIFALDIHSEDHIFPHVVVSFDSQGLIDELIAMNSTKNRIQERISLNDECLISLKGKGFHTAVDLCGLNKTQGSIKESLYVSDEKAINKKNKVIYKDRTGNLRNKKRRHKNNHSSKDSNSKSTYYGFDELVEYPVIINSCTPTTDQKSNHIGEKKDNLVYFEVLIHNVSKPEFNSSDNMNMFSKHWNKSSVILSSDRPKGGTILRFPKTWKSIDNAILQAKCLSTVDMRKRLCQLPNLNKIQAICDNINKTDHTIIQSVENRAASLCKFVLNKLMFFCRKSKRDEMFRNKECLDKYTKRVNAFVSDTHVVKPFAKFREKLLIGDAHVLRPRDNISRQNEIITIYDNHPEFKIVKISVIPNDPVPHDIYQVKMEYACATNQTVIKMRVSGSDKYSNYVTCHGITHCNCCTLHAAGASNAVVDHVTINITDGSTGLNMSRDMVVVF